MLMRCRVEIQIRLQIREKKEYGLTGPDRAGPAISTDSDMHQSDMRYSTATPSLS